jgi:hypothetical protein
MHTPAGSYGQCLKELDTLKGGTRSTDLKISHNKIVGTYHMHGAGDVRQCHEQAHVFFVFVCFLVHICARSGVSV